MNRRQFLASTAASAASAALAQTNEAVTKVHIIFKTHLDVGYTDMAANVVRTYFDKFIPGVLSLAERIRSEGREDRYVWTTGSWLIDRFLEDSTGENRRRMEQALERGDFVWHGLPFTTHTELIDPSLFRLGTQLAARLDRRFNRKTIAAKMTDVPGHTRGMVPLMAEAGLKMLHIGVNSASTPPDVPPLFLWRGPDGSEMMVMYQREYGGVMVLPGGKTAVSVSFTNDNEGPHSIEQIAGIYASLRKRFPNARVMASDLNAVAADLGQVRGQLPVVTAELGDTWIHGAASDPLKMARYREVCRLRREWIATGKLTANSDADIAFGEKLLRVAEHTWGLDVKTHLKNWDKYDMRAFRAARGLPEFKNMEASWAEKRAYIDQAIQTLPPELSAQAAQRIRSLRPVRAGGADFRVLEAPDKTIDTKHFRIGFDPGSGGIRSLVHLASGREWTGPGQKLGVFSYQTFSKADFDRFQAQYLTQRIQWALDDFGKPGLEKSSAKTALYLPKLKTLSVRENKTGQRFVSELEVAGAGDSGCPADIRIETSLPEDQPVVFMTLKWFAKPASRLPEALWFSFIPRLGAAATVEMDKMGQAVSPLDVVRNGNRGLHAVTDEIRFKDSQGMLRIETPDAFLVAPGRRSLLLFDNEQPDLAKGMHFCLCDNIWGTNFTMWFGEDMQYRFALRFA